ncbi:WD40-repeat-containing domain protein [Kockovaella imperatae]|uniref:WD40-repeat-containing domain protein n=1 Tax=Kockovaella imperatae TaxID=4999 RepID=A0A1Y1UBP0_9TREE|nr:WD40-repeat-containing domain protein [Kockovaella imperatae]ORX35460.1 WD40-repeat-containing domain protein [Kockovaella imperatae]
MTTTPQPIASSSKQAAPPGKIPLTIDLLGRLKPAKVFPEALDRSSSNAGSSSPSSSSTVPQIISIAFDDTGEKALTSGEDEGFVIWDMKKGRKLKNFYSKKYGVALARFTHKGNILHASTKLDHTIRYQSPHDNKYLTYFRGHTGKVRSLHLNPHNDEFISAGDDGTVRVWDLRLTSGEAVGVLNDMGGSVIAAFDNTGLVFGVACTDLQSVALYDKSTMDSKPFATASIIDVALNHISSPPPRPTFTSIAFSNNGDYILLGTSDEAHYILDAFEVVILRRLTGHKPLGKFASGEEVCFSSDSRYVMSGSADGSVCIWDLGTEKIKDGGAHNDPVDSRKNRPAQTLLPSRVVRPGGTGDEETRAASRCVRFNSRFAVMIVGGEELSFWLPAPDEDAKIDEGW